MDAKRFSDPIEQIDCWIRFLPLNSAHVLAVNVRIVSQLLLRNTETTRIRRTIQAKSARAFMR